MGYCAVAQVLHEWHIWGPLTDSPFRGDLVTDGLVLSFVGVVYYGHADIYTWLYYFSLSDNIDIYTTAL